MSGAAGVELYAIGANLGAAQDALNTKRLEADRFRGILKNPTSLPAAIKDAREQLQVYADSEASQERALSVVTSKFQDQRFVAGFGCNGGEEFLSYLQISETLLANKSKEFADWDKRITENINRVQTADGSWIGQHCITSRTFCTAAAVMVLTADRTSSPSIAKIDGQLRASL